MSTPPLPAGYALQDDTPPPPSGYTVQTPNNPSAPDLTGKSGEGTYPMWNDSGHKLPIPYSAVPQAQKLGYQFDTNKIPERDLTPEDAFLRDRAADPHGGVSGASFRMSSGMTPEESTERARQIEANAPFPIKVAAGMSKAAGTLGRPVLDVIAKGTGAQPQDIDQMLTPKGTTEKIAKYGTMGAAIVPAAVEAPVVTVAALGGGAAGGYAGQKAGEALNLSPENTQLLSDAGGLAGGLGAGIGASKLPIKSLAIGNTDAAALKGLGVGPKSKFSQRVIDAVQGARPYLQGAENLEDLQAKIPAAKAEVWGPYQQTIDAIGDKPVTGPDGPTTVGQLEKDRLELSALNRGLKSGDPASLQLANQKGLTQAQSLAKEKAVQSALDPHLEDAGIDPKIIRKTFGQISEVGNRSLGKSTIAEPSSRFGIGRAGNLSLKNPLAAPGEVIQGARDIVAGRPLFSGKATDINICYFLDGNGQYRQNNSPQNRNTLFFRPQLFVFKVESIHILKYIK